MMSQKFPAVVPVIELSLNLPGTLDLENRVSKQLMDIATSANSLPTPDGWFIPLADLKTEIPSVAEFLLLETLSLGEFEIAGGFQIFSESGKSIDFPLSSSFRDAVNLANAILNIGPSESRNFATGAQDFWTARTNQDLTKVEFTPQGYPAPLVTMPIEPLREELRSAKLLLSEFADELLHVISRDIRWNVSPELFRFMFALDTFD